MERSREQSKQWGRIGGLTLRSRHDPKEYTAAARRTFLATFEEAVDPTNSLPIEERQARAAALRRAHFVRLAARSAEARRKKAAPPVEMPGDAAVESTDAPGRPRATA